MPKAPIITPLRGAFHRMSVAMAEISCSARRMILLLFSLQSMTGFCCFIIDPPVRTHPGRWLLHGTEEPFQERDGCRHRIEGPVYDGIPDDPENHFPQIFAIAHIEEDANGELRQAATTPETVMSLPTRRCVRLMRLMTLAYSAVWIFASSVVRLRTRGLPVTAPTRGNQDADLRMLFELRRLLAVSFFPAPLTLPTALEFRQQLAGFNESDRMMFRRCLRGCLDTFHESTP